MELVKQETIRVWSYSHVDGRWKPKQWRWIVHDL